MDAPFTIAILCIVAGLCLAAIALAGHLSRTVSLSWRVTTALSAAVLVLSGVSMHNRLVMSARRPEPSLAPSEPVSFTAAKTQPVLPSQPIGPKLASATLGRPPLAQNQIGNLQIARVSEREMRVTVDYVYAGDHGLGDVFLHAAALEGDNVRSRVPGTGFPGVVVNRGRGRVTLSITRVLDSGPVTSTAVRACLVSIRMREAFLCKNVKHVQEWN